MKNYKFIECDECGIEYKISWDDDKFTEPEKCAGCGAEDPKVITSGILI